MKMIILTLLLLSFSGLSQARSQNHNRHNDRSEYNTGYFWQDVERRQQDQHAYINHGIERGQLTRREIKQLKRERKYLAKEIKRSRRHNYLSRSNKRNILNRLDYYSNQIRYLKRNNHYTRSPPHNQQQYYSHNNRNNYKRRRHGYSRRSLGYSSRNDNQYYGNRRSLSHANNNFSSGFYFRF